MLASLSIIGFNSSKMYTPRTHCLTHVPRPHHSEPVRLKYHDGGCDRNDSHGSVVVANIAEFLINDLDYLVSMRCVPHQSYKNPAEHVMASLNLGQQCLALERKAMSQEEEDLIKGANSMNKIRKVIHSQLEGKFLTEAIRGSLREPTQVLSEIYERCIFAGRNIKVHRPASDDEVANVYQERPTDVGSDIHDVDVVESLLYVRSFCLTSACHHTHIQAILEGIDPNIELCKKTSMTWKELRKSEALSNFIDTHCKLGTYKITIMKCDDPTCKFHKCRRLSTEEWKDLHPFPDAQLVSNGSKVRNLLTSTPHVCCHVFYV